MQIKPHQIEHHAMQRERFKMMRLQWHQVYNREVITEYSSYFSLRFKPWVHRSNDGTIMAAEQIDGLFERERK